MYLSGLLVWQLLVVLPHGQADPHLESACATYGTKGDSQANVNVLAPAVMQEPLLAKDVAFEAVALYGLLHS